MKRIPVCLAILLSLAACASLPRAPGCLHLGPSGAICLLQPAQLPAVSARHVVTVTHGDSHNSFEGNLHIDDDRLTLAAASLFGTSLFRINWNGQHVAVHAPRKDLRARWILAMLQAAVAAPDALRSHLHGMTLTVQQTDAGEVRELRENGRLVARIRRQGKPLAAARLDIDMPRADLHLTLEPVATP